MPFSVMAGLVPAIHEFSLQWLKCLADRGPTVSETAVQLDDVDGRDKPGHDGWGGKRPIRHCEQSEAIQTWAAHLRLSLDCFAVARNDELLGSFIH
jgi:hypothetical protein